MTWLKALARAFGKLLVAICLVIALFVAVGFGAKLFYGDTEAEAKNFCARTPLGQPWPALEQRILASKADQFQSRLFEANDGDQAVFVTFHGLFPLERDVCVITLRAGNVHTKHTRFMD